MGENLIAGLLRASWEPHDILAVDSYASRLDEMVSTYNIQRSDIAQAAQTAQIVVIVVKPQDIDTVLPELAANISSGTLVASLCAGITIARIEAALPVGTPVVRVMPNTPSQVSEGMTAISAGQDASAEQVEQVCALLRTVGKVVVVPEAYQDGVTAISGSGPAYLFFVAEAMIDAGVMLGLPRQIAAELVTQTLYGSAKLLVESGEHPALLRERVTSPGGTTAAALRQLEKNRVKAAFMQALEAARDRSAALAK